MWPFSTANNASVAIFFSFFKLCLSFFVCVCSHSKCQNLYQVSYHSDDVKKIKQKQNVFSNNRRVLSMFSYHVNIQSKVLLCSIVIMILFSQTWKHTNNIIAPVRTTNVQQEVETADLNITRLESTVQYWPQIKSNSPSLHLLLKNTLHVFYSI